MWVHFFQWGVWLFLWFCLEWQVKLIPVSGSSALPPPFAMPDGEASLPGDAATNLTATVMPDGASALPIDAAVLPIDDDEPEEVTVKDVERVERDSANITASLAEKPGASLKRSLTRRARWEGRTDNPLMVVSFVFLLAYALPIIWPNLPYAVIRTCSIMIVILWGFFIADYIIRLILSTNRKRFIIKNLFDLAVLALPILRPLRLLRMFSIIPVFTRIGAHTLRGRLLTYVGGVALLAVLVGSLAITDAERGIPGAFVTNYNQGLWWALDTLVTVGIDDTTIFSNEGHVVAFVLTIAGMAMNGAVTAAIAAWLVERVQNGTDPDSPATVLQVEALAATVEKMAIAQGISPIEGPEFNFAIDEPKPDDDATI